jgi:hypothetical protein
MPYIYNYKINNEILSSECDGYSDSHLESVREAVETYQARQDMLRSQKKAEQKLVKRSRFRVPPY